LVLGRLVGGGGKGVPGSNETSAARWIGYVDPDRVGSRGYEVEEDECFGAVCCVGSAGAFSVAALDGPGEGVSFGVSDLDAPGEAEQGVF